MFGTMISIVGNKVWRWKGLYVPQKTKFYINPVNVEIYHWLLVHLFYLNLANSRIANSNHPKRKKY